MQCTFKIVFYYRKMSCEYIIIIKEHLCPLRVVWRRLFHCVLLFEWPRCFAQPNQKSHHSSPLSLSFARRFLAPSLTYQAPRSPLTSILFANFRLYHVICAHENRTVANTQIYDAIHYFWYTNIFCGSIIFKFTFKFKSTTI